MGVRYLIWEEKVIVGLSLSSEEMEGGDRGAAYFPRLRRLTTGQLSENGQKQTRGQ